MNKISAIGDFVPMDPEGFLINPCSALLIGHPWDQAVSAVARLCRDKLGQNLHSLYLRGSIPQGKALGRLSDLDSFAILQNKISARELIWVREAQKKLAEQFPFVLHFEFHFYPLKEVLEDKGFLSIRFLIKCLSLCIVGEDLAPAIEPFKPSLELARAFYGNISEVLTHVLNKLRGISDVDEIKSGCAFIMKRLIRTGFGLTMGKEGKFTRDLYLSFQVFSKYYPEKEKEMRRALEWALDPTFSKGELIPYLENFGGWLVQEAERKFSTLR